MNIPKIKTIICEVCKKEHGLFYYRNSKGQDELSYVCDRVQKKKHIKGTDEWEYWTGKARVTALYVSGLDIPTQWSKQYAAKQEAKQQSELISNDPRRTKQSRRA